MILVGSLVVVVWAMALALAAGAEVGAMALALAAGAEAAVVDLEAAWARQQSRSLLLHFQGLWVSWSQTMHCRWSSP
jgi:hypothetical protein